MTSLPIRCLALAVTFVVPLASPAQGPKPATEAMLQREHLGALKLGLSEKEVLKQLGKPEKQGALTSQEADGTYVQQWKYPSKGLSILMTTGEKKTGAKSIASFIATAGCTLATERGIKIGSSESAVRKAYGAFADSEHKAANEFVAGSIYGGIIFDFEKGKVSRIFFGAAAE
ncbi:MAG: hypothetical protein WCF18_20700 [Chthoniobacteraceae bacterium]